MLGLFDLDADPGELNNLAGRPETRETQQPLMEAMQEKMVVDHDFIRPAITEAMPRGPAVAPKKKRKQ